LIQPKPETDFDPIVSSCIRDNFREMVETYIYTDTIRTYFETIFDHVARGAGQGFWVQAEYGAGKSALSCHAGGFCEHRRR